MQLKDPQLLERYMEANDFSQARLGRYAGCSRQFVWMLINRKKSTCTKEVGTRIEEALRVLPGTLFVDSLSTGTRQIVTNQGTAA